MGKREEKYVVFDEDGAKILTKAQLYERKLDAAQKCIDELLDAAEFETRVNRKLTTMVAWAYDDGWDDRLNVREYQRPDFADTLKWARLAVEEEMDA